MESTHQDLHFEILLDMVHREKKFDFGKGQLPVQANFKVIDLSKVAYRSQVGAGEVLCYGVNQTSLSRILTELWPKM